MVARPYWKGQSGLALVSIPVEICSATRSGAVQGGVGWSVLPAQT
jgi:non-homologous end joining protein Ku